MQLEQNSSFLSAVATVIASRSRSEQVAPFETNKSWGGPSGAALSMVLHLTGDAGLRVVANTQVVYYAMHVVEGTTVYGYVLVAVRADKSTEYYSQVVA